MPLPKKRLLIHKESGLSSEPIQYQQKRKVVFAQKGKSVKFLKHLRLKEKNKRHFNQAWRDQVTKQAPKHFKPKGSFWRFYRIETLVKRNRTKKKLERRVFDRSSGQRNSLSHLTRQCGRSPILLVIRLRNNRDLPEKVRSILEERLSLYEAGNASLLRNTPQLMRDLVTVGPYVTFGEPSKELVRDLILKRGRILLNEQKQKQNQEQRQSKMEENGHSAMMTLPQAGTDGRVALDSNVVVEQTLGHLGMICLEDIIDLFSDNPYESKEQRYHRDREFKLRQLYYERYPLEKKKDEDYLALLQRRQSMKATKQRVLLKADLCGDDEFDENAERIQHRPSFIHINESSIERADSEKLRVFDEVTDAVNPFVLQVKRMPLRGMKNPYSRRGYWGYRGNNIDQFVEQII